MTSLGSFDIIITMLMLKLKRIGKKHQASYRLIVDEKRHRMYGKNVEDLGWYDPKTKKSEISKERTLHWIKNGAQPSDTVHNLLISLTILSGKKIAVHKQPKKKEEAKAAASAPAGKPAEKSVEAPKAEAAPAADLTAVKEAAPKA